MSEPAKYITECRICKQQFQAAAFVPILNGGVDPRITQFGNALCDHMMKKHQAELGSFLIATCFLISDPGLVGIFEPLRWAIQKFTRRANVTDEQLRERLTELSMVPDDPDPAELAEFLKPFIDLRDYLTEEGAYALAELPNQIAQP